MASRFPLPSSYTALLRPLRTKLIKCHFYVCWEPFWAWVCLISGRQDAINELFN